MQRQLSSRVFGTFSWHFPVRRPGSEQFTSKSSNETCVGTYVRTVLKKDNHDALVSRDTKNSKKEACLLQHTSSCQEETDVNPVTHPKGMLARSI